MPPKGTRGNKLSLLILFGIAVLNFITLDRLHGGVWLSIAAGALATDLLDKRRFPPRVARTLQTVEVLAIGAALGFTVLLIAAGW
jgi:hypothetical protein